MTETTTTEGDKSMTDHNTPAVNIIAVSAPQTCPHCHDSLTPDEGPTPIHICTDYHSWMHRACYAEFEGCGSLACCSAYWIILGGERLTVRDAREVGDTLHLGIADGRC